MRKCKFFFSLLKERDWLEQMAREGWQLTNMTLGVLYHFEKTEPAEKVFEIEHFGASNKPRVREVNARRMAIDIAKQAGWSVVTHDEEMNYYFVKEKEEDASNEFYDEPELRKERAERYRYRYGYEIPMQFSGVMLCIVAIYFLLYLFVGAAQINFIIPFIFALILIEMGMVAFHLYWGNKLYDEMNLSREQWEQRKAYGVKKKFRKVQQLRGFLQEKSMDGFVLASYEDGKYIFEKSNQRYDYFIDTKKSLKKRLKKEGIKYERDKKDWNNLSLKWYEMSIAEAEKRNLCLVCIVERDVMVYSRIHSDDKLPWENGNENIGFFNTTCKIVLGLLGFFFACYVLGYVLGIIMAMLIG